MSLFGESNNILIDKIKNLTPYRLLWLSVIASVLGAEIVVVPLSLFFHGRVTRDYIITGIITAFLVSLAVSYILVRLIRQLNENIIERNRAVNALAASENRYKAIVEDQAEFVCRYISGGVITFANDTICRYANMKKEDLLGQSFHQFIHKDYIEDTKQKIAQLNIKNPFTVAEAWIVLPDGKMAWHRWNHHAIFNEKGEIVEYQCTGNDLTELKLAEKEREKLIGDLSKALDDVKKLSGLLPMCASCKNIRDENGSWTQLEEYISSRSEAMFTHSVCPECTKKLYPEHYENIYKQDTDEKDK